MAFSQLENRLARAQPIAPISEAGGASGGSISLRE